MNTVGILYRERYCLPVVSIPLSPWECAQLLNSNCAKWPNVTETPEERQHVMEGSV